MPSMLTVPESADSRPAMIRSSVDLPPPDGPEQRGELPGRDGHGDVVEGDEVAERLVDVL